MTTHVSLIPRLGRVLWLAALSVPLLLGRGDREIPGVAAVEAQGSGETEVTIGEGTNFAVVASPDGKTLVIDLLGSLWTLPAQGGAARRITEPLLEARRPSFSPKGDRIVFEGYLDDGWDLWAVAPDGSGAKRLTWGPFDDKEPQWSHDGSRIAFASDRSGSYDIWILDVKTGNARQVTSDNEQDSQPGWSPDDRQIAFVSTRKPGGVWAVEVDKGTPRSIAAVPGGGGRGFGGANSPVWAPDGRDVVYTAVGSGASTLTMPGRPVVSGEDVFPFPIQWLSANEFLYTADGKIQRRTLGASARRTIEFTASVPVKRAPYSTRRVDFDATPRSALGIIKPSMSPDGARIVFAAVGDLWVTDVGGGEPRRLTSDQYLDADPAFSPDGSRLVFSTDRAGIGNLDLWIRDLKTGQDSRLTEIPTGDLSSSWSPDGTKIAFLSLLSHSSGADLYVVDVATKKATRIHHFPDRNPSAPTWSPDGRTLMIAAYQQYSQRYRESAYRLLAIPSTGGDIRILDVLTKGSNVVDSGIDAGPIWSPDGSRVAFLNRGVLKMVEVDQRANPLGPVRQLTHEPAHAPSWTRDSRQVLYMATDKLKLVSVDDGTVRTIPLNVEYRPRIGSGRVVVHAGRVWSGTAETTQRDVDIVIDGNRIREVRPHDASLHSGRVIDASDRTVLPGLVDMHAHVYREYGEALGRLMLSYGITSARETAGFPYRSLEMRESWIAGSRVGPRLYVAAPTFDGTRSAFAEMYTVDDALRLESEMERAVRLGYDLFKLYVRLPAALQKRATEYAHEKGIHVTGHLLYPAAAFGADGTEHGKSSSLGHTYQDVTAVIAASGMAWCPTMALGGLAYVADSDPSLMTDERTALLADWALNPTRQRVARFSEGGANGRAQSLERLKRFGGTLATVLRSGGTVIAGTDAPGIPHGIALHAELESYVLGGLTPIEALRTTTVNAARVLGVSGDVGTIEPGKLADLVITEGDPLVNIRDARRVTTIIKNGEVFTRESLLRGNVYPTSSSSAQ